MFPKYDAFVGLLLCSRDVLTFLLYRQPLVTKTASTLSAGRNDVSSAAGHDAAAASLDQSDDTAADPEVDDLAAARAQLRARAGARGRRSNRPGRGAGGHGQVKADSYFKGSAASLRLEFITVGARRMGEVAYASFRVASNECNCPKNAQLLAVSIKIIVGFPVVLVGVSCRPEAAAVAATATGEQEGKTGEKRNRVARRQWWRKTARTKG